MNNNLAKILLHKNMGSNELARKAGISAGAVSEIINGKVNPRPLTKRKIASALNMKVEDIFMHPLSENNLQDSSNKDIKYKTIQSTYTINFYKNLIVNVNLKDQISEPYTINSTDLNQIGYKVNEDNVKNIIAIAMKDNSMQPNIRKDDILFIDTTLTSVENNKIYLFEYEDELYIRQLAKEKENSLRAKTFNSQKGVLIENIKDVFIFGKLVLAKPSTNLIKFN